MSEHKGCCQEISSGVWVCGGNETETPWMPTNSMIKRWGSGQRRVPVHCCNRWELPRNTECMYYTAYSGYVAGHSFRCAPKKGCNKNPNFRRTKHLREIEYA